MDKHKTIPKDRNDRREELLRPSRYLGYDRDRMGLYLFSRGAYKIAESQFRRAVWLNPYEYRFVLHLAWCLYSQGCYEEAIDWSEKIELDNTAIDDEDKTMINRIKQSSR